MTLKQIAILTFENDIHGLAIHKAFESYNDVICYLVETDRICNSSVLSWSSQALPEFSCTIPDRDGVFLDIAKLDVIWWRRTNFPQQLPPYIQASTHIELINNDCSTALLGILINEFSGRWINHPTAIFLADNKLIQLQAAQGAGFRIPQTLVSQNPTKIRQFCARLGNQIVVKPVKGLRKTTLFTRMLTEEHLASDDSLRLCPAIYQEYIPGTQHIRVHCFGDAFYAVLIESEELDWRQNLEIPFSIFELHESVKVRLRKVLKALDLKMGIIDLKLTDGTNPVWLEINQQGQFLFSECLSGLDLTSAFTEFLYQEAHRAKS